MKTRIALIAALAPFMAFAAEPPPPPAPAQSPAFRAALPPEPLVDSALDSHPDVQRARALHTAAEAERIRLAAGSHEFVASAVAQGRRDGPADAEFLEGQLEVTRTLRSPSKARLDRQTGEFGALAAENAVDDARHQAARTLAELWFNWVVADQTAELDRRTVESLEHEAAAIRRRVELKDAAVLEQDQTDAARAAAQARAAASLGEARTARVRLQRGYPELTLPEHAPALPEPVSLTPEPVAWREIVMQHSHEIRIAENEARRQQAVAARARLDRNADPTIGVRAFADRGGRETGLGVFVSRPIGGAYRSAGADMEAARAAAALAAAAKVRREVLETAESDIAMVEATLVSWGAASTAVRAASASAQRTRRAYDLGERDLVDALLAERQLQDAQRSEVAARAAAWKAASLLRIDAHDLWAEQHE